MNGPVLLDTGPLVAALNEPDQYHAWAGETLKALRPPLLTCEPVLTEAAFLLRPVHNGTRRLHDLLKSGAVEIAFDLEDNLSAVFSLMERYGDVPMSLADACLVRMAEIHERATVFTLDADFRLYRKHGRHVIPTLMPS